MKNKVMEIIDLSYEQIKSILDYLSNMHNYILNCIKLLDCDGVDSKNLVKEKLIKLSYNIRLLCDNLLDNCLEVNSKNGMV